MPKVTLLCHTPDPQRVVAAAAKLCYSSQTVEGLLDGLTDEKTESFIHMLMGLGHESPVEHVSFTFAIEGVSRLAARADHPAPHCIIQCTESALCAALPV